MDIAQEELQQVCESVCDDIRVSWDEAKWSLNRQARLRLRRDSDDREAAQVLAATSLSSGDPDGVIELLSRFDTGDREDATSDRLAGYAWLIKNDRERARHHFGRALSQDPHLSDCWNLLGKMAEDDREEKRAIGFYERGIVFDDAEHRSALSLSRLHARNHRIKDAIHTLRVSLLRDQRSPILNLALGRLLDRRATVLAKRQNYASRKRTLKEALQCYRVVNAARPNSRSLVVQGYLEQQLFEFDASIRTFQKAVEIAPASASALTHLAGAALEFGDLDEAIETFEKALEAEPGRAETHFRYSRSKRFKSGPKSEGYLRTLERELSNPKATERQRISLDFAKAKVHDDLGEYESAWGHYRSANQLKTEHALALKGRGKSEGQGQLTIEELTRRAVDFFKPEFFRSHAGFGHGDDTPVFIIGMPRSGTTLTEQILSSHPQIAGAGELNQINQIRQQVARESRLGGGEPIANSQMFPYLLEHMEASEVRRHADEYLNELHRFRGDASRVTDKMPTNFMYLGLIALMFPNATVIHCRRDPMDVLISCYCQNLRFPFCDLEQLREYHRCYRKLMRHWKAVLPIRIYESDYESLVSEPEERTRGLIEHCGLPWDDACLSYRDNHRAVHTPSKWQVRQPMYRSSVQKWRRFESQLAPLAEQIELEIRQERAAENGGQIKSQ